MEENMIRDKRLWIVSGFVALACTTLALAQGPAPSVVDQKAIVCDGKAKNDGKVEFQFTPQGGEATTISVTLQKGMKKQEACRDIAKEFSVALGEKFKVDQYDDDKVKIEGKDKALFSLTLGAMTVEGFTVKLK